MIDHESAMQRAREKLSDAIADWHQGGVGMHTNDSAHMQRRRAEHEAMIAAIDALIRLAEAGAAVQALEKYQAATGGPRSFGVLRDMLAAARTTYEQAQRDVMGEGA